MVNNNIMVNNGNNDNGSNGKLQGRAIPATGVVLLVVVGRILLIG